ncbi:MAG: site-specific DNA-methyltransferase [Pseudomonadaceae bacterium]|nr:site-specific DNA-methyltransferase [Pseudomonadaceae bacterium]
MSKAFWSVHAGDCLETMRGMADNSVDSVVCDPPYGLSFMGKKWDYDVPSTEIWAECLRVLKPGGHLLAFAGTRTQHRMAVRIEDAGFEIRDMLAWMYGSGFPKSHNGEWGGTALKPAIEPITMARKPLIGTVAANFSEHGTGGLNIDGCRVELHGDYKCKANGRPSQTGLGDGYDPDKANCPDTVGRWPANLIHDGSDEVVALFPESTSGAMRASSSRAAQDEPGSVCYGVLGGSISSVDRKATSGSAARFFYCAKASRKDRHDGLENPGPQFKSGTTLRNVENTATAGNNHPTVKPTDLMAYLCRLVTPPGGVVFDPFMGSGSTGKAAVLEGFSFIGCELSAEYVEIASARISQAAGVAARPAGLPTVMPVMRDLFAEVTA